MNHATAATPPTRITARQFGATVMPILIFVTARVVAIWGPVPMGPRLAFELVRLAVATLILATIIAFLFAVATRKPEASGTAVVSFLAILAWPLPFQLIEAGLPSSIVLFTFALTLLLVCTLVFRMYHPAVRFLLLAAIVINSLSVAMASDWNRLTDASALALPELESATASSNDVIVIVLDGYGRSDLMTRDYGYDNSDMRAELVANGFRIIDKAHANYSASSLSIGSFLAQEYLATPTDPMSLAQRRAIPDLVGGNSPLVRSLQENGREYVHVASPWIENRCAANVDTCVPSPLYNSLTLTWIQGRSYGGPMMYAAMHPFPAAASGALAVLSETDFESEPPLAMFVHVLSPHVPHMLAPDCTRVETRPVGDLKDQFACIDRLLVSNVDGIPGDALVVILGDHGPEFNGMHTLNPKEWNDQEVANRLSPFAAIRLPDNCEYPPMNASLINVSRYVSACALGTTPDPLPDRSFVLPVGYPDSDLPLREINWSEISNSEHP